MYRLLLITTLFIAVSPFTYAVPFSTSNLKEDPFSSEPLVTQKVNPLRELDKDKSEQQRTIIKDLAARHLGKVVNSNKNNDLELLQQLLDRHIVEKTDRFTLQAMGVVLGDVLAKELHLEWVLYQDKVGNTRALAKSLNQTEVIFPITMISRRVEAGINVNVTEVYHKAVAAAKNL